MDLLPQQIIIRPYKVTYMCMDCLRKDRVIKINIVYCTTNMIRNLIIGSFIFRFVGVSYLKPWRGLRITDEDNTMIFLTKDQAETLAGSYPPYLWIRGPAGSGKTYLLVEKAVTLAQDVLKDQSKKNEKILVLCNNDDLCEALERTIKGSLLPESTDVSSFLHFTTFTELVKEHLDCYYMGHETDMAEMVNYALKILKAKDDVYMYDHILVDEGEDMYGENWPVFLQRIHKSFQSPQEEIPGSLWVIYGENQTLRLADEIPRSHLKYLSEAARLKTVLRNTKSVFQQSTKYFRPLMHYDSPIELGRDVPTGDPIEWDDSLGDTFVQGAKLVVKWINKLQDQKVHLKDICILVWDEKVQTTLRKEIDRIGGNSQTGDDLIKRSLNCAVVETVSRFKGFESKVVILFNPAFIGIEAFFTHKMLYIAVSRCSCFLVVISTKEGCNSLKSDVGLELDTSKESEKFHILR